jgi:23S rRNA (guanine745-N1)-methyltransferase
MYLCPLCQNPLALNDKQYQCANRHSFDIAREGYVNLLPVQQKNSKDPGDNKEMMLARRAFLHAGWYAPLAQAVCDTLTPLAAQSILDTGCGEGYYTAQIKQALPDATVYGVDISKAAIKFAAKANSAIQFSVASVYQLPFAAQSFDAIVRIYAPSKPLQVKQAVYDTVRLHSDDVEAINGFNHLSRQRLQYQLSFSQPADVLALIQMVPLAWKFSAEQKQQFAATLPQIDVDFLVDLHQRSDANV